MIASRFVRTLLMLDHCLKTIRSGEIASGLRATAHQTSAKVGRLNNEAGRHTQDEELHREAGAQDAPSNKDTEERNEGAARDEAKLVEKRRGIECGHIATFSRSRLRNCAAVR
jgi:hypothetical protein